MFYRPSRDVYYSLGGNVGGDENIVNAGVSFSFGHRSEKPAVNTVMAVSADNADYEACHKENAELKNTVRAQNDKINVLEYRIKHLERLMLKMAKKEPAARE